MNKSNTNDIGGLLALALLAAVLTPPRKTDETPNATREKEILDGMIAEVLGKLKPDARPEKTEAQAKAEKTIDDMIQEIITGRKSGLRTGRKSEPEVSHLHKAETPEQERIEKLLEERGLKAGVIAQPTAELIDGTAQQFIGIITTSEDGYSVMLDAPLMKGMPVGDYEVTLKRIIPIHAPV